MRLLPIAALLLATQLGTAQAATQTVLSTQAPGSSFLELQQFDTSLGQLDSVTLTLTGSVWGTAKAEATATGGLITLTVQTSITLGMPQELPGNLLTVTPFSVQTFDATAYDGLTDFQGPSGATFSGASTQATLSNTVSFSDQPMLDLFTGTGSLSLPMLVTRMNALTGPSSLAGGFSTRNSAEASAVYSYSVRSELPPVPEPSTWALLAAGLAMVGWLAQRRRA